MKLFLEKAVFINRSPFEKLELDFNDNEVAILSAANGKGKTTILSHIVDSFHEMAKPTFSDYSDKRDQYYRVSSGVDNLNKSKPSFVYLRYKTLEGYIDYIDVRKACSQEQYDAAITIENKIPFQQISNGLANASNVKIISTAFSREKAKDVFSKNILTYFPSYRYETPGYLNNVFKTDMNFKKTPDYSGFLSNPIEVVSGLPTLANWILDVVLDIGLGNTPSSLTFTNLNQILTQTLISKNYGSVRFGIGPRGLGGTRIQVTTPTGGQIYPSIFNLSSGEAAVLCIFGELIRQADRNKNNILLQEITGIVLIDEVDKHLHIKLQKEVLPKLFELFPAVQFIVSSHAPFLNMGLAETIPERAKIIDLDSGGITRDPTINAQYVDVYNMMIGENERFKESYEAFKAQIDEGKKLQIVTEGKNTSHIKRALEILDPSLLEKINFVTGIENKTGKEQLKSAFDTMSKASHMVKFLFIWDCDAEKEANAVTETSNFFKYRFEKNTDTTIQKGIENLYPSYFADTSFYQEEVTTDDYGAKKKIEKFNKDAVLTKALVETNQNVFKNFQPLLDKMKSILQESIPAS